MQRIIHPRLPQSTWLLDLCLLIVTLGTLFLFLVGTRPLFIPEEGRYAEIGREMLARHDYLTPYLNGIKYFEKPVLFYWLEAAAMQLGGVNLWSLRAINALLGLGTCLSTYVVTRWLYDRSTALLAATILGTSLLFFVMTHMISMDIPLTFFMTATLYTSLGWAHAKSSHAQWFAIIAACLCAGFGVLTKGLIGILLPIAIITPWLAMTRQWRALGLRQLLVAITLFLALVLPWHLLVAQHNPGFFQFYIIEQHFLRYTTSNVGHLAPWWYFLVILCLGFLPWTMFAVPALVHAIARIRKRAVDHHLDLYWCLWLAVIFLFFSFSKSKLAPYILPIFPALAIVTARYVTDALRALRPLTGIWRLLLVINLCGALALAAFPHFFPVTQQSIAQHYLIIASILLSLGSLISYYHHQRNQQRSLFVLTLTIAGTWLTFITAIPAIDTRPTLPFAKVLNPILQPSDHVIAFNQYFHDLPFYLEHPIHILNWRNELSFGASLTPQQPWLIDDKTFWLWVNGPTRVFIVMSQEEYAKSKFRYPQAPFYLWSETRTNVLVSNRAR